MGETSVLSLSQGSRGNTPAPHLTSTASAGPATATLVVENMHCGGCMLKVERALRDVNGVSSARVNLAARRVTATFDGTRLTAEHLVTALANAGYRAAQLSPETANAGEKLNRDFLYRLSVAGFAAANIMLLSVSVWSGEDGSMDASTRTLFHWLSALIAIPAVAYAGQPFFRSAAQALRAWHVNMDVPISLAILLSLLMSMYQTAMHTDQVYFDACVTLLFFLLIGRFLDQRTRTRARSAAQNLMGLKSQWASVIAEGGLIERLPAYLVTPGMRVSVAAGERLPVDGKLIAGVSDVDESLITGETLPRTVHAGDTVYAGTVNLGAAVEVVASATENGSVLAEIVRLMEAAEQSRSRYVRLADRAAKLYAPGVHTLAAVTFIGWFAAGLGWQASLTAAIAVLIITCPCALALAVPAVQVAAASRLFAKGVLVKAPDGLERLAEVDTIVFDKTGTLTHGVPALKNAAGVDADDLKGAASLAANSRHPYAVAVVTAARNAFGEITVASDVTETPGAGLERLGDQGAERLGSALWCGVEDTLAGQASLWYARPGHAPVGFVFEDELREDAAVVIASLKAAGYKIELLSGDRRETVERVARQAGIEEFRAECRPGGKIERLATLRAEGRRVLMVGDGLNDAPALAAAHASLSPSTAADISQTASDAVFQGAHLAPIIELLAVASKARRMSYQNFGVAGAYNVVFVPLAMAGLVIPLVAALAMSTSSIVVTVNALRLRTMRLSLRL